MTQVKKAEALLALHKKGAPLVLFNIWDAGTAKAVADAGAQAVATGSWSVAAAQGFADGEALPLDILLEIAGRIVTAVDVPVSIDFEGGYAAEPEAVAANVARLIATGAVGLNFEDQVVGGEGLYPVDAQVARIAAIRAAAEEAGVPIVINARTDVFLKERDASKHAGLMGEVLERGAAFAEAGGDSFFIPGTADLGAISEVCAKSVLPVNVMHAGPAEAIADLAAAGVGRVSHGPFPYRWAMADFQAQARI